MTLKMMFLILGLVYSSCPSVVHSAGNNIDFPEYPRTEQRLKEKGLDLQVIQTHIAVALSDTELSSDHQLSLAKTLGEALILYARNRPDRLMPETLVRIGETLFLTQRDRLTYDPEGATISLLAMHLCDSSWSRFNSEEHIQLIKTCETAFSESSQLDDAAILGALNAAAVLSQDLSFSHTLSILEHIQYFVTQNSIIPGANFITRARLKQSEYDDPDQKVQAVFEILEENQAEIQKIMDEMNRMQSASGYEADAEMGDSINLPHE